MPYISRRGETFWVGPPPETPGTIYVLCFGGPRSIKNSDGGMFANHPGSHYVGITRRPNPLHRIREHGRWCVETVVALRPGNEHDEKRIKDEEVCPKCGGSLDYFTERRRLEAATRAKRPKTTTTRAPRSRLGPYLRQADMRARADEIVAARRMCRIVSDRRTVRLGFDEAILEHIGRIDERYEPRRIRPPQS